MATKTRKSRAKRLAPRFGPYDPIAGKRVRLKAPPRLQTGPPPEVSLKGETPFTLVEGVSSRVKPFHHPSSQTPAPAQVKTAAQGRPAATRGGCPAPVTQTLTPSENHRISRLRTPRLSLRGRFGLHEADCAEPRPMVIGL